MYKVMKFLTSFGRKRPGNLQQDKGTANSNRRGFIDLAKRKEKREEKETHPIQLMSSTITQPW
jgi:hypothetical protein